MTETTRPPLSIVQLVDGLRVGGAERLVVQAAEALVSRGARVTVVALDGADRHQAHLDDLRDAGVAGRFLPALTRRALGDPGRVARLAQLLLELEADVVQSHLTYANILGGLAARRAGIPLVATLHNSTSPPGRRHHGLARAESAVLDRCASAIVGVGPTVVTANDGRFRRAPLVELANPVAMPPAVSSERRAAVRVDVLDGSAGPLVLAVGRLSPQKAFDDLITAAAIAAPSLPGLVVAIAGEGLLRADLERLIETSGMTGRVRLLGIRSDVAELMAAADALAMTSHWEGLPLVLLEAMAAGLPVLATDVGDVPSVLRVEPGAELLGMLVPPGRPDLIAEALVELAAGRAEVEDRAARARSHVERTASLERWSDRLFSLLGRQAAHRVADDRIRVAVLSHGYWPRIGGIERQRGVITPLLRAREIDARVVCRRDPDTVPFDLVAGVPVHRVAVPGTKPVAAMSYTIGALARVLAMRPDVIHAHEFHSTARVGLWAARIGRRPLVVSAHRSGALGDVQRQGRRLSGRIRTRRLLQRADLLVAVSAEIAAEMVEAGASPDRVRIIRNGVDVDRFAPLGTDTRVRRRAEWGWSADELITVFVGRIAEEKRVEMLIESWRETHRSLASPGTLVIAGEGPERERLEAATAGESVVWLGIVDDPSALLSCADVFVLASAAEGLSNALLEAAAAGLGIVVTDVGGAREVIDDGETGLVIPPDDPGALADAMKTLLGDPDLRHLMGGSARVAVAEQFGADRVADAYAGLYRELAGRPSGPRPTTRPTIRPATRPAAPTGARP